jgi:hypothetical protein
MFEKFTETSYWENLWEAILIWSINTGPKILIILILFFISAKLTKMIITRFQKHLYKLYEGRGDNEGIKRVVTLSELLKTSLLVVLYVIFTLELIVQFGVNIAPLLAGAGIIGLAKLDEPLTIEPIGMALTHDNPQFLNLVDNYIDAIELSGDLELLDQIWFEDEQWIVNRR